MISLSISGLPEVPVEARAFLAAVAAFVVFLFIFFLYLNKKLCFHSNGGFPCCDESSPKKLTKDLGLAYNYNEKETSSDSENEASKRLSNGSYSNQSLLEHSLYHNGHQSYQSCHHTYHQLGISRSSSQYSARDVTQKGSVIKSPVEGKPRDLISLAEKGRASIEDITGNVVASSSSASSSGSTTSGDDELLTHRRLRNRDPRGYHHLSPGRSPYQVGFIQEDFDISEEGLLVKCGSIEAGFSYDFPTRTLTVHILQAKDVPSKERGGITNSQVRLLLLPTRKQKQKTKIRTGANPHFNESFVFNKVNPEDVQQLALRIRLCGCERMRRERIIGEAIVPLAAVNMAMGNTVWLSLEQRANSGLQHVEESAEVCSLPRSDSTGSSHSIHGVQPELLVGLIYNGTTGCLAVEVIKGSHFRNIDEFKNLNNTRTPDTYVKLTLTSSSGYEIASAKSSVRRGQPSPLFKETFMFQVALFQLPDVTLMVTVYAKRPVKRKDVIGWFSMGLNSSGEEEMAHWNTMRDSKCEQICRWHCLLES